MSNSKKLGRKGLREAFPYLGTDNLEKWFAEMQGDEPNTDDATLVLVKL
jgi:hypothetical protein